MVWWSKRKPLWEHTASGISTAGRGDHSPAGSRVIASIIDSRRYAGPAWQWARGANRWRRIRRLVLLVV